ncbi:MULTISPECIES: PDZ domain-containing protein [Streptomyces]|uniref:PDZ domain-containing protein n=2 Tax=Streptomyces TaxID=1883 RepID=A0A2U9P8G0_STRAS|nr:PDZ domain-containing protein [Streptomyces actuosus]AWT46089.1 PDZ domain-containing protein [Streptomyces actuosus]MBM4822752.1 PDZ domain-containing protein [Streptomyces actuosus]
MEPTALRPKPMPGQEHGGPRSGGPAPHRPHAARRRGRRLSTLLFGLLLGLVLLLAGVGLGTVGATVIGMSKLADLQRQASHTPQAPHAAHAPGRPAPAPPSASPSPTPPVRAGLGVEAMDAEKAGALVVGVHAPGPGYAAGLVRGDILLAFDHTRIDSAADLARAVAHARPGSEVTLTVRHRSGGYQQLTAVLGVVV